MKCYIYKSNYESENEIIGYVDTEEEAEKIKNELNNRLTTFEKKFVYYDWSFINNISKNDIEIIEPKIEMVLSYKINFKYIFEYGNFVCDETRYNKEELKGTDKFNDIRIKLYNNDITLLFITKNEISEHLITSFKKIISTIKSKDDLEKVKPTIISLIKEIQ